MTVENLFNRINKACTCLENDFYISGTTLLEPADGLDHNKVMPPTYSSDRPRNDDMWVDSAGKNFYRYHIEPRYEGGKQVQVVVLDSTPSCANRLELEILSAREKNKFDIPLVQFKVKINEGYEETYSAMTLSHRIFAAQFKYTVTKEGVNFLETPFGRRNGIYDPDNRKVMRTVFLINPVAILLGGWRSHVKDEVVNRARAYRKARAMVMEVIGIDPLPTKKTGGMLAPVEIGEDGDVKPSEIGLGSVPPSLKLGGVSVREVKERMLLSLNGLYEYDTGNADEDAAARTMLACMGLYAHTLRKNYFLRSGCHLRKKETQYSWNGDEPFAITTEAAHKLYEMATTETERAIKGFKKDLTVELLANNELTERWKRGFSDNKKPTNGKKKKEDKE